MSSWIIQDGNYDDFTKDQISTFALEFYPSNIFISKVKIKSAELVRGSQYKVVGEIVYINQGIWVVDFGLCAYQESNLPRECKVGDFVSADIYLGIDYFIYFESLYNLKDIPPLIYTWEINRIYMHTAPFVLVEENGSEGFVRDESKWGLRKIENTDCWNDDDGHASYILQCQMFDEKPKYSKNSFCNGQAFL